MDSIVLGVSGWLTQHGTRYHEERRTVDEIAAGDWSQLLAHAETVSFFTRPESASVEPNERLFHLKVTAGERSRELAIKDPFENGNLAKLVGLARRCLRDRIAIRTKMTSIENVAAIRAMVAERPTERRRCLSRSRPAPWP